VRRAVCSVQAPSVKAATAAEIIIILRIDPTSAQ
jgi:hypothetical protein